MRKEEPITGQEKNPAIQFPGDLRDWFAGMALMGKASAGYEHSPMDAQEKDWYYNICSSAYKLADAMLKEREK